MAQEKKSQKLYINIVVVWFRIQICTQIPQLPKPIRKLFSSHHGITVYKIKYNKHCLTAAILLFDAPFSLFLQSPLCAYHSPRVMARELVSPSFLLPSLFFGLLQISLFRPFEFGVISFFLHIASDVVRIQRRILR